MSGRTVFAVTHRLSSAEAFDRVLVFDKGRLVQDGLHGKLIEQPGLYRQMWGKVRGLDVPADGGGGVVSPDWLGRVPFLAGCPPELLQSLAANFLSEEVPDGREVIRQGDPGAQFYILARGTVEVLIARPSSNAQPVARLRDVTDQPRNATVRTVTDCWFLTLHRTPFLALIAQQPQLQGRIMATVIARGSAAPSAAA